MWEENWLIGSPGFTYVGVARLSPPGAKSSRTANLHADVAGPIIGVRRGVGERVHRGVAVRIRAAREVGAEVGGFHDPDSAADEEMPAPRELGRKSFVSSAQLASAFQNSGLSGPEEICSVFPVIASASRPGS